MNNEKTIESKENILGFEKIGKLIRKFAIPAIIAMLVNSLYNIVDQIFIGWGVGYLGNIHEGPQGIHWGIYRASEPFKHGMTMTNEPGLYISGSHGIRLENELIIRNTVKNEYGQFMEFEVMTFVPWDLEAVKVEMLTSEDIYELNKYHKKVFEVLSPYFEGEELEWLKEATREV